MLPVTRTPLSKWIINLINYIPNLSLIITPLVLSPLIIGANVSTESKCAFLVLLTATLWAFNPIPLPITSMFPIVLLPLLSLASTETACSAYLKGNNMLFLGCLALALAVEKSNLHQRVALKVLLCVSTKFNWILLCFMLTTASFSMWIVSTATVAMMLPIADEIFNNLFSSIDELNENGKHEYRNDKSLAVVQAVDAGKGNGHVLGETIKLATLNGHNGVAINGNRHVVKMPHLKEETQETLSEVAKIKARKMFYLCIAYSATIGSVSTLTANGPNLVMKDVLEE